jgi:hypothetical protein
MQNKVTPFLVLVLVSANGWWYYTLSWHMDWIRGILKDRYLARIVCFV